ncbi:MAG: flagellar biosynthesis protein FliR [Phycisphaerae bacterium]|nr:MAG: flagellar biosynthesis protein FliR [Phycisphaerae bacterium]
MANDDIFMLLTRGPLFLPLYALVMFRISGLMIAAPLYGSTTVPARIRVGLAAVIALAMFPVVAPSMPTDLNWATGLVGVFGELIIGLVLGLTTTIVFTGIQLAGMVIGQQAGLGLGQVFNPALNSNTTIIGQLFFLVALTSFILMGGHRELMRALLDTFATIPVMSYRTEPQILSLLADVLTTSVVTALRLVAPVLMSLFITTLVLGFVSRTMPQMNILSVGFVVRTLVALAVAGLALSAADGLFDSVFSRTILDSKQIFNR